MVSKMAKKQEGKLYQELMGSLNKQAILDATKADFPYKIYKENEGFGENPKPAFSFYEKNPMDPDKSFPVEDLLDVEREIALWLQKWFGKT
jgi:hypothetical protein